MLDHLLHIISQYEWLKYSLQIGGLFLAAWIIHRFVTRWLSQWALRTATTLDDQLVALLTSALKPILILAVSDSSLNLFPLSPKLLAVVNRGLYLAALAVALYYGSKSVLLLSGHWLSKTQAHKSVQEPFFAGFYLRIDNPIRLGDYVKLDGGDEGFILHMGWRSTQIRTLSNNVVIVPNSKLASAIVTNYSLPETQMSLLIPVRVSFDSDPTQVERVLVDEAIRAAGEVPGLLADPPPFVRLIPGFGEASLEFTLICRVNTFVDQYLVQHELRKRILTRFRREGISMLYTQHELQLRETGWARAAASQH